MQKIRAKSQKLSEILIFEGLGLKNVHSNFFHIWIRPTSKFWTFFLYTQTVDRFAVAICIEHNLWQYRISCVGLTKGRNENKSVRNFGKNSQKADNSDSFEFQKFLKNADPLPPSDHIQTFLNLRTYWWWQTSSDSHLKRIFLHTFTENRAKLSILFFF